MRRPQRTLILTHCPPNAPWSGERRLVAAAEAFFGSISQVDVLVVERNDELARRVARKVRNPLAPPYAARFGTSFAQWDRYDTIWVYEVWAMSCVPRRIWNRILWDKDTLMGDSFLQQARSRPRAVAAHWIRRYERALIPHVRWAFLSNPDEVAELALPRVSHLPHGVAGTLTRASGWRSKDKAILGFTGVLGYAPNRMGLIQFLQKDYAAARCAGAALGRRVQLRVAGTGLSTADRELVASYPDVTLLGYVDDIADFYREIDVALAPMTLGAGSATKVMEALAHGVPVIGTEMGLRGLDVRLGDWAIPIKAPGSWAASLNSAGDLVEASRGSLAARLRNFRSDAVFERVVGPVVRQ